MTDQRTISRRLQDAGYVNIRDDHSDKDGRHTIVHLATGKSMGRFEALEALNLITKWTPESARRRVGGTFGT